MILQWNCEIYRIFKSSSIMISSRSLIKLQLQLRLNWRLHIIFFRVWLIQKRSFCIKQFVFIIMIVIMLCFVWLSLILWLCYCQKKSLLTSVSRFFWQLWMTLSALFLYRKILLSCYNLHLLLYKIKFSYSITTALR